MNSLRQSSVRIAKCLNRTNAPATARSRLQRCIHALPSSSQVQSRPLVKSTIPSSTNVSRHSVSQPFAYRYPSSSSPSRTYASNAVSHPSSSAESTESTAERPLEEEPRLSLTFTCTAPLPITSSPSASTDTSDPITTPCGHRSSHTFTKRSYTSGIVIIACPSCKNRHLIADNLGWFKNQDGSEGGRTVEDFMRLKGEEVKKGKLVQSEGGDLEFVE